MGRQRQAHGLESLVDGACAARGAAGLIEASLAEYLGLSHTLVGQPTPVPWT